MAGSNGSPLRFASLAPRPAGAAAAAESGRFAGRVSSKLSNDLCPIKTAEKRGMIIRSTCASGATQLLADDVQSGEGGARFDHSIGVCGPALCLGSSAHDGRIKRVPAALRFARSAIRGGGCVAEVGTVLRPREFETESHDLCPIKTAKKRGVIVRSTCASGATQLLADAAQS